MKSRYKLLIAILFCLLFFPLKNVYGASTDYAVKFSSDSDFTLYTISSGRNSVPTWDGIMEYSLDNGVTWTVWDGKQLNGTATKPIYIRGKNNTVVSYEGTDRWGGHGWQPWRFTGYYCEGNIENLLDYETVQAGGHPEMADYCFYNMFYDYPEFCPLKTAPMLCAVELTQSCYEDMFNRCASLEQAPELPATTLADSCYENMFMYCENLEVAPELPATTLANDCYASMFYGCTSLEQAPELPAMHLAEYCYASMFKDCENLRQAPELPAITLANYCYLEMFEGCTRLQKAPVILPCNDLGGLTGEWSEGDPMSCYGAMFAGCENLKQTPILPATNLSPLCYAKMFKDCTSLEQISELPAITLADACYYGMFDGCTNLKLSETQEDDYPYEYNLGALSYDENECWQEPYYNMFVNTGGTFTGTPEPNKTYYVNFKTVSATQTVEIPVDLPKLEKKDNIPNTSLDDVDKKSACEIIANVYYAYYVSMPATLTLAPSEETDVYVSDYKVKAKTKTDGLSGKYIKVSPEHSIDLTNENNGNTVPLTIEQEKEYFGENNSSDVVKVYADKWVETKGRVKSTITEQGNYKGNFKFEYGLVDSIDD